MPNNTAAKTPPSDLGQGSQMLEGQVTSESLPKSVSMQLFGLMNKVVATDVNPQTVQAACACATEIHRMLKLNLEIKRTERSSKDAIE